MALTPGTRIASYTVVAPIGAGGMGEVYRARDTQLDRDVALKILPPSFASDADRVMRFTREAKALAALNHPNIAAIYGLETAQGAGPAATALVMELVEGEDLSSQIARGPLAVDEALTIARQIAEALEAAHEQGIVHRDLKPANIKIRADGTVKVLDFGLAKALDPVAQGFSPASAEGQPYPSQPQNSPTFTSPAMTQLGIILGTAAYMAPEQAKGKAVDKRADIWAFGCVLFEMLSGERPFAGEDVSETLAAVLKSEPDWTKLPSTAPPHVRAVLAACLQKDPRRRLRDIGDARLQLERPFDAAAPPAARSSLSRVVPWLTAGVCALAAVTMAVTSWRREELDAGRTVRLIIPPPEDGWYWNPVLAPDGAFVAFAGSHLYVRDLGDFTTRMLPGTENAAMPFVAPDGRWIGFYANGRIRKIAVSGGDPVDVCAVEMDSPGAAWGPDNQIYFSRGWTNAALAAVSPDGGEPRDVSTLDPGAGERGHWWPHALPDGRHVLFTIWYAAAGLSQSKIGVLDLQTGRHRALFPGAVARYAAGHVLYFHAGSFYLVPFDTGRLSATGDPRLVLPDALGVAPQGTSMVPVGLAEDGTVAFMAGSLYPMMRLAWIGAGGRRDDTGLELRMNGAADLSPDGTRIAVGQPQGGTSQIIVADLTGGNLQRLSAGGMNWVPIWHPDGQRLAFISMRKGDFDTYGQRIDGSAEEALAAGDADEAPDAWLPDGNGMILKEWQPDGSSVSSLLDLESGRRTPLVAGSFQKAESRVSPDGRWLAAVANPSGVWHVHVRPLQGTASFQQVSAREVHQQTGVRWAPDGRRLYYLRDWRLVALALTEREGILRASGEEVVAELPQHSTLIGVSPDGARVLVGVPVRSPSADPRGIRVIVNGLGSLTRPASAQ